MATFANRADRAVAAPEEMSYQRAIEALATPGSVLDVGAGAGAASLPLPDSVTSITAVDTSQDMLDAFAAGAAARRRAVHVGARQLAERGASQVPIHDVVLAHHVVYNVPAIGSFLLALDRPCRPTRRRRVATAAPTQLDDAAVADDSTASADRCHPRRTTWSRCCERSVSLI